jgi:hypothetical protein|tara:strand:- start:489 stop:701 length:213 start_codon:yes stop_codon:yes gene_type:complete
MDTELLILIRKMIEDQEKKYADLRDGSLKQWDSNYKTNEYKRRGVKELLETFDNQYYNPLIENIKGDLNL